MPTRSVLLVHQERAVRHALRAALLSQGYVALEAGSALEALFLAAQCGQPVDALVAARHLDGIDGGGLARKFSARFPGAAVIFLDAAPEPDAVVAEVRRALDAAESRKGPGSAQTAATILPCRQGAAS